MIKMVNKSGTLTKTARDAFQGAFICGTFDECIRIPRGPGKTRRIAALLNSLNIGWGFDDDFVTIHRVKFFREAVSDLSSAAVSELAEMIPGFAQADAD